MRLDLSIEMNADRLNEVTSHQTLTAFGHLGTHIDVIGKNFSLDNFRRTGKLFDVSAVRDREIVADDFHGVRLDANDFVLIYTGFIDRVAYGSEEYFGYHPELSMAAIDFLLGKKVSLIGIDAPGLRRGLDHPKVDRLCAEKHVFVVENLVNLAILSKVPSATPLTVYTLPANITGWTGLPCRVIAEC